MLRVAFISVLLFSNLQISMAAENEEIGLNATYVEGSWGPDEKVPSNYYDVPGDRNLAVSAGQAVEVSVDDVFGGNTQFTEDSFKGMLSKEKKQASKKKMAKRRSISKKK